LILTAANGKEAVQAFVSNTVDLVLLDYQMPQRDGGVAAIHMKACKPDVPIALLLAMSGCHRGRSKQWTLSFPSRSL
jgi:CheY-like chemotaxis protein